MINIDLYKPIIKFFALYLGSNTEILLCDTERILYVENSFHSSHEAGKPIDDKEKSFIEKKVYEGIDYTINYRSLTFNQEKLRSATLFIKDQNNELKGMITINTKVTDLLEVRRTIDRLINGDQPINSTAPSEKSKPQQHYEIHSFSVVELIQSVIDESVAYYGVPPQRLTADEKLDIVRKLDDRGIFLVKGSIAEVAKRLFCSEATIYRYLQQINS
ncbi:MAG TPA: helix-turn-helix domain-containing protein [Bacillota bacterium]|jgi:predicted transcriptional regulator YheO|nr:helix-turn-helix domain-containing protein [Bacillota bacterium]